MTPAELADLHARCFATPKPWSMREFQDLLCDTHTVLVGTANGFALGRVIADEAELLTIAVEPGYRRKGLGRRLLTDLERASEARGATRCFLEVATDNHAAIALYNSAGYREVGRRSEYYRPAGGIAMDAIVLSHDFLAT